jgi:hypothetical protein
VLSPLLTAFRRQYPRGSLVSELLTIHDGLYVVRVVITVDELPLSTGLAAQNCLETAEDEACDRALSRLGLSEVGGAVAIDEVVPPHPNGSPPVSPLAPHLSDLGTAAPSPVNPRETILPSLAEPTAALEPLEPSVPSPALIDRPASMEHEQIAPQDDRSFENDLLSLEGMPNSSIDLSDIIAQTDVELQRLGWGVNQGREFLEKTYGKRSRHDLTDEELLEFLLYLETQPSPSP